MFDAKNNTEMNKGSKGSLKNT